MNDESLNVAVFNQVLEEKRNEQSVELKLRVEKFNADGSADAQNQLWQVPMLVGTRSNPNPEKPQFKCVLKKREETITIPVKEGDWISVWYYCMSND